MDTGEFFDKNNYFYGCLTPYKYDYFFIDFIHRQTKKCNLLDIGGGGGCFTKICKEYFQETNLCIVDPSKSLLQKQELNGIKLVIGKLPDELNINDKFDYIHIKEVLHHITGSSITESKKLLRRSLINSQSHLNNNGYLLIHELFYESYIAPTFTRTLIFYLLKLQNFLGIRIPAKEFIVGLDVCFYTRNELKKTFEDLGFETVDYYEEDFGRHKFKKLLLVKDWGRMCFILRT
jgi:ubiquinone/menaquinone biosynthesis C-methylase UbiE